MAPEQKPGRSKQDYGTPDEFLIAVRRRLGVESFAWDLSATRGVNECSPFGCYTLEDDALAGDVSRWLFPGWCWLNPPYSDINPWVERAYESGRVGGRVAVLIPASIGANWWVDWVEGKAQIIPLNGRITFVGETDAYPKDCALLLYGPDVAVGYDRAWRWMDTLTEEELEMAKKRTKKEPKTPKVRSIKDRKRSARAEKPNDSTLGRVTTFAPNAQTSVQPAPDPAELDLGAIQIPGPDDAVRVLTELASLNDRALLAKDRYETLKEATKGAKEKYDELAEQVLTRLRQSTHKTDLPLFADTDTREADQAAMEAGPEAIQDEPAATDSADLGADEDLPPADEPPLITGRLEADEIGPDGIF